MRLVVFSDLHLDTTFAWAPREVARRRRANLRETLRAVVALADEVDADVLCSAGDLYEHEHVTPETGRFVHGLLADAGRPVVLVAGNHDPLVPGSLYASLPWPDHVHVVDADRLAPLDLVDGVRLWAASHHVTAGTPGFLDDFRVEGDAVHYALFHGSEEQSLGRESERKQPHAPFTSEQIPAAGLAHALVGHFHTPRDGRWHTYPGNPDPLTFGEDGDRGAVVVDVAADGTPERTRHRVAVSEVHDLTVDVTGATTTAEVVDRARTALGATAGEIRVTVTGELAEDLDLQPQDLTVLTTPQRCVVPRIGRLGVAHDLDALAEEQTVRGQFVRSVTADDTLDEDARRRILVTGLRALDGRDDLEVV